MSLSSPYPDSEEVPGNVGASRLVADGAVAPATPTPGEDADVGLARVGWVRVLVTQRGPVCDVFGVDHRRPARRRVSLRTATALAERGVPTVLRRSNSAQGSR